MSEGETPVLIPSLKVVFEGPSREYFARLKTIAASRMTGCARLVFSDFEGTVFYRDGRAVTALQETGMWMALGPEMIAPLENKAMATAGTIAVYELAPLLLNLFEGRKISTTVETDLGALVNARMLIDNLRNSASTCIVKVRGQAWTGYVFMKAGNTLGASYVSEKDRHYGDTAINAITKATGKAEAAIYFLEGGAQSVEVLPPVSEATPAPKQPVVSKPPEVVKPAVPAKPVEAAKPAKPTPAEKPAPAAKLPEAKETKPTQVAQAPKARPPAAPPSQAEVRVATSEKAGLKHRSRMATLEALESREIAWVDESVLKSLRVKESDIVRLMLPGEKAEQVTLARVDVLPGTRGIVILPEKLRKRLSLKPDSTVILKPG